MGKPLRVLMVEDSADDAELLLRELHRGNYDPVHLRVQTAEGMAAALAGESWDLVVCDYSLPQFTAPAALKLMGASGLDIPFLVVSGVIGEDVAVSLMKGGAHDCIMKYNLKRLVPAVERELREAEVRRERRTAEEKLRKSEEQYRTLAEAAHDDIFILDRELEFRFINQFAARRIGRRQEEIVGRPLSDFFPPTIFARQKQRLNQVFQTGKPVLDEDPIEFQGRTAWMSVRLVPLKDEAGRVVSVLGLSRDITDRKQAEELVQHVAFYDPLTELPNRNRLYDRLLNAIRIDENEGKPMALLLMDLDHFKEVNDTLGHHRGDLILQQVGARLKSVLFEPDVVSRLGGDEFAVFLPRLSSPDDISQVAEKVQSTLEAPFMIEGLPIAVEASIGIALYPDHGENPDSLMQRADVAMYVAKETGGYVIYDAKYDQHSPRRLALMGELRNAIEQDQLFLHYQPKIDLKTDRIIGVEALARWQHPVHGFIPPVQFIPAAERTGLIRPLTHWILEAAHRQCLSWQGEGWSLGMAVNLSARNLHDGSLPEHLGRLLESCGGRGDRLELEITESAIMADPARAMESIKRLRDMGIRFAIDDFGTGYSSLGYLKRLPVETIKIDKSFVLNMANDENDASIVRSTIELGHNLGLHVVAEGIENRETYDRLKELGCDAAQGYFMCKPLASEDLPRWLEASPFGLNGKSRSETVRQSGPAGNKKR